MPSHNSKIWLVVVKHRRFLGACSLVILIIRLIVPCPIHGNYVGAFTSHMCDDHAFLRFADGQVRYYHGDLKPHYNGAYEKVGWNTYIWKNGEKDPFPETIHVGWFFIWWENNTDIQTFKRRNWLHRDCDIYDTEKMLRKAMTNAPHAEPLIK